MGIFVIIGGVVEGVDCGGGRYFGQVCYMFMGIFQVQESDDFIVFQERVLVEGLF